MAEGLSKLLQALVEHRLRGLLGRMERPLTTDHASRSEAQSEESIEKPFPLEDLLERLGSIVLRQVGPRELLNLRLVSREFKLASEEMIRHNKGLDNAFRVFLEHSPRALEALLHDTDEFLLEVVAIAISLDKGGRLHHFASSRYPQRKVELPPISDTSLNIFWHFICDSHHPVVIFVPQNAIRLIKDLPEKLKSHLNGHKRHHRPALIFKADSQHTCSKLQNELKGAAWHSKYNAIEKTWSFPLSVFAVAEDIGYTEQQPLNAYYWDARRYLPQHPDPAHHDLPTLSRTSKVQLCWLRLISFGRL